MVYLFSIAYTACFIFVLFHVTKFEFKFRLKYKWYLGLFNSLCLSVAELILLVYLFEKWALNDAKIYLYFIVLYDYCFAYVFMGFNHALIDFQASIVPFPPDKLAKVEIQKFFFSLIVLSALISLRHIVFAACNYQKSYETLKRICRTANKYSEPTEDTAVYFICFLMVTICTILLGSFSTSCLTLEPGCNSFSIIPRKWYVFPYIQYLYVTYLTLYLFLICKLKSQEEKGNG